MTANAVIEGTYSDLRFIKTRKVAQVIVEIPIERAGAFVEMFGAPDYAAEIPVALARLYVRPDGHSEPVKSDGERAVQKAGILCNEPAFQRWLTTVKYSTPSADRDKPIAEQAAICLRLALHVQSRRDLAANEEARRKFNELIAEFDSDMRDGRAA